MHVIPIGVDTETKRGKPITFQFYSEEIKLEKIIFLRSEKHATKSFLAFLDALPATRDRHFVMFGHHLAFDCVSLFYDRHSVLRDGTIESNWLGWEVRIVYGAPTFATFRRGNKSVTLIDTFAYFVKSLAKLGDLVCPDLPKLQMPKGLGQKRFKASDKKFVSYAMRDAVIAYRVGKVIMEMHAKYDVSISVSAPHFASKVFKRHFLRDPIPLPPRKIVYSSLSAYHGGKNNVTVRAGLYRRVYSYDIKSAYPHAMHGFPSFSNPALYKFIEGSGTPKGNLPPFGVYCVRGRTKECKWPILFDHAFKPIFGEFRNIWTTGFELNEALRAKEIELDETFGYYYDAEQDDKPSPFKAYVDEFFNLKETAKEKIWREIYKLLLNSLYGKFIQTRSVSTIADLVFDIDEKKIIEDSSIVAGGLFNPFIAALICGHTRANLHRYEHEFKALHTSTDGIKSLIYKKRNGKGLGDLSLENPTSGDCDCLILRNKLYIDYRDCTSADRAEIRKAKRENRKPTVLLSRLFKGKVIYKYALHGFHGSVETLEELWRTGTREYEYTKVNKLRESLRRNLQVNDFVTTRATLKLKEEAR